MKSNKEDLRHVISIIMNKDLYNYNNFDMSKFNKITYNCPNYYTAANCTGNDFFNQCCIGSYNFISSESIFHARTTPFYDFDKDSCFDNVINFILQNDCIVCKNLTAEDFYDLQRQIFTERFNNAYFDETTDAYENYRILFVYKQGKRISICNKDCDLFGYDDVGLNRWNIYEDNIICTLIFPEDSTVFNDYLVKGCDINIIDEEKIYSLEIARMIDIYKSPFEIYVNSRGNIFTFNKHNVIKADKLRLGFLSKYIDKQY